MAEVPSANNPSLRTPCEWRAYLQDSANRNGFYSEVCSSAREEAVGEAKSLAYAVKSYITALVDKADSPFFITYIDEAHHLEQRNSGMIRELMSAMADIVVQPGHVSVLTSTNTQLSTLPPAHGIKVHGSARWQPTSVSELNQVWTTFPYKIFSTAPPDGQDWTPAHARSFEASASLGRPL